VKRALVIGCAANVWNEVEEAQRLCTFDAVYCVKMAGVYWKGGRFVWAGLHPEHMAAFTEQRTALGLHADYEIVAPTDAELGTTGRESKVKPHRRVSYLWPGMNSSAGSGIYGAKVALDDGHDRVVLAGIPMTATPYFAPHRKWKDRAWADVNSFNDGFEKAMPFLAGKVRSMSGRTQKLLGLPTTEWLA
jgi:hypothetical protein